MLNLAKYWILTTGCIGLAGTGYVIPPSYNPDNNEENVYIQVANYLCA